jgi:hypothetical protein
MQNCNRGKAEGKLPRGRARRRSEKILKRSLRKGMHLRAVKNINNQCIYVNLVINV